MSHFHHGSIRKYTAALLDVFNSVEIQYKLSTGESITKEIPLMYSSVEKTRIFDQHTVDQFLSGNYNILPRANLALVSMSKAPERITNKNNKIGKFTSDASMEFMYNSVPYEFAFDIVFQCRGMNEATQIIEQLAPKFNPTVNIDVWDASNLDEPTRVPVNLLDIQMETEEYEELSSNIVTIVFNLKLVGNLYPPIKATPRIQELQMYINQIETDTTASRKEMLEWDVDLDGHIIGGGLDIYTDELTIPTSNGESTGSEGYIYNTSETKTVLDGDRVEISGLGDYFESTTIEGILQEIAEKFNQPGGIVTLDPDGTLPNSITTDKRVDEYIQSLDATNFIYADGSANDRTYALTGDLNAPIKKMIWVEFGTGATDPLIALSYNQIGKISRSDYYLDRTSFTVDGTGRDGYATYTYNEFGKLITTTFNEM